MRAWKLVIAYLADGPLTFDSLRKKMDYGVDQLNSQLQIMRTQGLVRYADGMWHKTAPGAAAGGPVTVKMPQSGTEVTISEPKAPERETIPPEPETVEAEPETTEPEDETPPQPESEPEAEEDMATRVCKKCEKRKNLDEFTKVPSCTGGRDPTCKQCRKEARGKPTKRGAANKGKTKVDPPAPVERKGLPAKAVPAPHGAFADKRARLVEKRDAIDRAIAAIDELQAKIDEVLGS